MVGITRSLLMVMMSKTTNNTNNNTIEIRPQPGPQEQFLSTSADLALYGGAAGGGKTYGILLECARHIKTVKGFGAVVFRRTYPEVTNEGGLWDTSTKLFPQLGGIPRGTDLSWEFPPYGNRIKFSHMKDEKNKLDWQGAQIPLICFDEITHFSETQFFYLFSRNRSVCGVKPYVRGSCNPDADSWVYKLIEWYVGDDGYILDERSGVIRWFLRSDDVIIWGDSKEELMDIYSPDEPPTSFTFIKSSLEDNKILMSQDPSYRAKLMTLPTVERERLLYGNWKIKPAAGLYFKRAWADLIPAAPQCVRYVRYWDPAATDARTAKDPDWTTGLLMGIDERNELYVLDVQHFQKSPGESEIHMAQVAQADGKGVMIREEQEPGSSGKKIIYMHSTGIFKGYNYLGVRSTGSKVVRAGNVSSAFQNGIVHVLIRPWNTEFFNELEGFPERRHDDQVDALSGAYDVLTNPIKRPPKHGFGVGVVAKGGFRV